MKPIVSFDFDGVLHTDIDADGNPLDFDDRRPSPNLPVFKRMRQEAKDAEIVVCSHRDPHQASLIWDFVRHHRLPVSQVLAIGQDVSKTRALKELGGVIRHYDDRPGTCSRLRKAGVECVQVDGGGLLSEVHFEDLASKDMARAVRSYQQTHPTQFKGEEVAALVLPSDAGGVKQLIDKRGWLEGMPIDRLTSVPMAHLHQQLPHTMGIVRFKPGAVIDFESMDERQARKLAKDTGLSAEFEKELEADGEWRKSLPADMQFTARPGRLLWTLLNGKQDRPSASGAERMAEAGVLAAKRKTAHGAFAYYVFDWQAVDRVLRSVRDTTTPATMGRMRRTDRFNQPSDSRWFEVLAHELAKASGWRLLPVSLAHGRKKMDEYRGGVVKQLFRDLSQELGLEDDDDEQPEQATPAEVEWYSINLLTADGTGRKLVARWPLKHETDAEDQWKYGMFKAGDPSHEPDESQVRREPRSGMHNDQRYVVTIEAGDRLLARRLTREDEKAAETAGRLAKQAKYPRPALPDHT